MFEKEQKVIYGNVGVCKVIDVTELDFMDDHKLYYTLQPLYDENKIIYAPVEGHKHKMRPIISEEEAEAFIRQLPHIEPGEYSNEKERKEAFHEAFLSGDLTMWASSIHYIHKREQERIAKGQKISTHYMEEMKSMEKLLLGELAAALGLPYPNMKAYIIEKLG